MSRHGARGIPIDKENIQLSNIRKIQKNYGSYKGFLLMHPGRHINVLQFNHCFESTVVSLRIRIHHFTSMQIRMGIRIRFRIQVFEDQKQQKIYSQNFLFSFDLKNYNFLIPRPLWRAFKLQEKPPAFKREHPVFQSMELFHFFWGSFLPDPDPHS
jgi:hypothetical protein